MTAVSVVIPVLDRRVLLERALASVAAQTLRPAQVIVVDDGSTDGSADVAERAGATVLRQQRSGVSAARNAGLRAASTDRVAFLDSDDEWRPNHLAVAMAAAGTTSFVSTAAVTSKGDLVGSQLTVPLRVTDADRLVWPDNPVVTSAVVVDRAAALAVGGFDAALAHSEDLDLWARLLGRGPGLVLPDPTVRYHLHPGQVSLDVEAMRSGASRLLELGVVGATTRRRIATRDSWDRLRAAGRPSPARLAAFLQPDRAADLALLLAHRARGRRIAGALAKRTA